VTLVLRGVCVAREGFPTVRDVDLDVPGGEVTVLLGPNGAGKTTLLEAVSGVLPVAAGSVLLDGTALETLPRDRRARLGLAHVEQGRTVFAGLTVEENLLAAAPDRDPAAAFALFPELARRRRAPAGALSGGEQQMLVIARALATAPSALLIDELSLGLAPVVAQRLAPVLRTLADRGVAVLAVEQFAALALAVGDRAHVLKQGRIVLSGRAADLRADGEALREAYLGSGVG